MNGRSAIWLLVPRTCSRTCCKMNRARSKAIPPDSETTLTASRSPWFAGVALPRRSRSVNSDCGRAARVVLVPISHRRQCASAAHASIALRNADSIARLVSRDSSVGKASRAGKRAVAIANSTSQRQRTAPLRVVMAGLQHRSSSVAREMSCQGRIEKPGREQRQRCLGTSARREEGGQHARPEEIRRPISNGC